MTRAEKGGRGEVRMVDVGFKPRVRRRAVASGRIALRPGTLLALREGRVPKGDVLGVARVAAITAVKRTSELLPLCHPLALTRIDVDLRVAKGGVEARVGVEARERTGVEMEALVGVTTALLTVWDMVKALEKDPTGNYPGTRIERVRVEKKIKG